jgi:hypothetical protein
MMAPLSRSISVFSDGSIQDQPLDDPVPPLPLGYFLAQYGEDKQVLGSVRACASGGCPAVMILNDAPDTIFDKQWQFFVYAINKVMSLNAIIALMGDAKALMNNTGFGDDADPRRNWLTGNNMDKKDPRLDKLRTFSRATHAVLDYDATRYKVLTFDGNQPPPLKPGRVYPQTLEQVNVDDYLMTPRTHPHLFMDCNNNKNKPGGLTSIFPFANGAVYYWTVQPGEMFSFFPLVSWFSTVLSPKKNWNRVTAIGAPYRRVS